MEVRIGRLMTAVWTGGFLVVLVLSLASLTLPASPPQKTVLLYPALVAVQGQLTAEKVRNAIHRAQNYLLDQQGPDGSWAGPGAVGTQGVSVLATLALLESEMDRSHPRLRAALRYIRGIDPTKAGQWRTYITSLHTMALLAAGDIDRDLPLIQRNARFLEATLVPSGPRAGAWGYGMGGTRWDNSNTQFAILGLHAAAEAGVQIDRGVWERAYRHFVLFQNNDGSWSYQGRSRGTGSMTVAGISSLVIAALHLDRGKERVVGGRIVGCGEVREPEAVRRAILWLGRSSGIVYGPAGAVDRITNPNSGAWILYYLYGLERAGRLSGRRFFGLHDWYRDGASWLVRVQDPLSGAWKGANLETPTIATSFALLFLSKGLAPVLINKLKHGSAGGVDDDWNIDPHDVRYLTREVARLWGHRLNWQIIEADKATVDDLLQAPILFLNGHRAPVFSEEERRVLREYVMQGGVIFAEACCASRAFDEGFRKLVADLFPEGQLMPLPDDHPIWRAQFPLEPDGSLWGMTLGCRTSIIYSPEDLSCYWQNPQWPESVRRIRIGVNVVAYVTGREIPPDKLSARRAVKLAETDPGARDTLRVGKLRHGGDWNAAPLAIAHLMAHLRDEFGMRVALQPQAIGPGDPELYRFPLLYMHGRNRFSFSDEEVAALRGHLERGGTLFADACCGSEPFDEAFRDLVRRLFPNRALEPIPPDDPLFSEQYGYELSTVRYTSAMPQRQGPPILEGVKIDDRWAIIYSRWDLSCALERRQGADCRGYVPESAVKIATNIVLYALLR